MQQGFHFNIPQDLVAKLREEQGFKDSKATGRQRIDPSKLTFLKGKGPKKSQSEKEEESKELLAETPSKQIQITEDWEDINDEMPLTFSIPKRTQSKELNSAGNFDGVEGEKIKATSEADGTNDDLWHSLPDYIDENEEPVIILNLRYLYGAGIPPAQAARLGRQLAETLHEDFAARAAELWELEDLCHHATTATEEAVAARLGRLHPEDAFCRVRYPPGPLAGGPSARHLWWGLRRPAAAAPAPGGEWEGGGGGGGAVERVRQLLRDTNRDLLWKAAAAAAVGELAAAQRREGLAHRRERFLAAREEHLDRLAEAARALGGRLAQARAQAAAEEAAAAGDGGDGGGGGGGGGARPVTRALIAQLQAKLGQIEGLMDELAAPPEPEPTESDLDPENWETVSETVTESESEGGSVWSEEEDVGSDDGSDTEGEGGEEGGKKWPGGEEAEGYDAEGEEGEGAPRAVPRRSGKKGNGKIKGKPRKKEKRKRHVRRRKPRYEVPPASAGEGLAVGVGGGLFGELGGQGGAAAAPSSSFFGACPPPDWQREGRVDPPPPGGGGPGPGGNLPGRSEAPAAAREDRIKVGSDGGECGESGGNVSSSSTGGQQQQSLMPAWRKKRQQQQGLVTSGTSKKENSSADSQQQASQKAPSSASVLQNSGLNSPHESSPHQGQHQHNHVPATNITDDGMTLLDQLMAMILGRYPRDPNLTDQQHCEMLFSFHKEVRQLWVDEFGTLPGSTTAANGEDTTKAPSAL